MLTVKTRLGPSDIAGIGLFADENIKAGAITWRFTPGFDQVFTAEQVERLPEPARTQILNYTYLHAPTGCYVFCLDNARFMNHAEHPNTAGIHLPQAIEGYDVATRDIARGEEITCDYGAFDGEAAVKLGR